MLLPYRARIRLFRFPIVTVLLCVLCIAIYVAQDRSRRASIKHLKEFCSQPQESGFRQTLTRLAGKSGLYACARLMLSLERADDPRREIDRLAQRLSGANQAFTGHYRDILQEAWQHYSRAAPADLTRRLWYDPRGWNVPRMLTAAVAHGSWAHLIGNLFFFFAFAATLEMLLGPILYTGVLVILALGTHVTYALVSLGDAQALPTLGLSGVVMGVMALLTWFVPHVRIQSILFLVVFWKRFAVPAWLFAVVYIGWDLYSQLQGTGGSTNLIAHLSGAMIGLLLGITLFRRKRHWAQELVET